MTPSTALHAMNGQQWHSRSLGADMCTDGELVDMDYATISRGLDNTTFAAEENQQQ
jgi:hypothetical protein